MKAVKTLFVNGRPVTLRPYPVADIHPRTQYAKDMFCTISGISSADTLYVNSDAVRACRGKPFVRQDYFVRFILKSSTHERWYSDWFVLKDNKTRPNAAVAELSRAVFESALAPGDFEGDCALAEELLTAVKNVRRVPHRRAPAVAVPVRLREYARYPLGRKKYAPPCAEARDVSAEFFAALQQDLLPARTGVQNLRALCARTHGMPADVFTAPARDALKAYETRLTALSALFEESVRAWKRAGGSVPENPERVRACTARWRARPRFLLRRESAQLRLREVGELYEKYVEENLVARILKNHALKYKNKKAWHFTDGISLYTAPTITTEPGFDVYRNSTLSLKDENAVGCSYTPDYLIKVRDGAHTDVYILDAKYSSRATTINYQLADMVFKYLFTLSPDSEAVTIKGLYLIYGKTDGGERDESIFTHAGPGQIRQDVRLIPLSPQTGTF